jgi:hypothetical protein
MLPPAQQSSLVDLVVALGEHLLAAPLWLILAADVGQSIPMPQPASMARIVSSWSLVAVLPLMWSCIGGMLVIWWRQGRGPLWSYPLRWALMLFLTFISLVALLFPKVRGSLVPPRIATT